MGLSYTGIICFDILLVIGKSLVPEPPASIMPFICNNLVIKSKIIAFNLSEVNFQIFNYLRPKKLNVSAKDNHL